MEKFDKLYIYRNKLVKPYINKLLACFIGLSHFMSLLFIITLVYEHGFIITQDDAGVISRIYHYVWLTYLVTTTLHLALDYSGIKKKYNTFTWILTAMLYLSVLPLIFKEPEQSDSVYWIWNLLNGKVYNMILLVSISLLRLSNGIVLLLGKRISPSGIFSASFLIFIIIGTGMLMLPRATYDGISFIDALFISTSSACVTGLTSVDVATTFTPMGFMIIAVLIQIGGVGVMTLTSFFAMFFMGNASVYNQVVVREMVSSKSLNSLFTTILYILGFTVIIEAIGAAVIFFNIHNTLGMTFEEELAFSVFHSISAFCNAGFSTLPDNLGNSLLMNNHNIFYLTISALIILGGIGFPILVNIYETVKYGVRYFYQKYVKKMQHVSRQIHLYNINTKIVIIMTTILLATSIVIIAFFEWNNAFRDMPVFDKLVQSFFNAACPRTAGFSSVSMTSLSMQTLFLMILLMVIGGGTQSTAGGVKVNVFAVVLLNLKAIMQGSNKVTIFNRELSNDSIRRSNATLILYLLFVFVSVFLLTVFEPEASPLVLVFESISALSTVGSSLGITPELGSDSKLVVIFLMFIGRVGVLTIMTSIIKQQKITKYKYPSDNIIIN